MVLTRFPIGLLLAWFYNRRFELPIETSPKPGFLAVADNVQLAARLSLPDCVFPKSPSPTLKSVDSFIPIHSAGYSNLCSIHFLDTNLLSFSVPFG